MKRTERKFHAQRKFAQGAFVPGGSSERRSDVTPAKDAEDKRSQKVIVNNNSPSGLLDVVSLKSIHNHSQPIVLIERLPKKSNDVTDPRDASPRPPVNIRKEPPKPKIVTNVANVPSDRYAMSLRSRTNKKQKIVRKKVILRPNIIKNSSKRKGNVSSARRKSSIMSGFSTDDDMPLKQTTKKVMNKNIKRNGNTKDKEDASPEKRMRSSTEKILEAAADATAVTFGNEQHKENTQPILPLSELNTNINSTRTSDNVEVNPAERGIEVSIKVQAVSESSLNLTYDESESEILPKSPTPATFYGPSEIEKWIVAGPSRVYPLPPEEVPPEEVPPEVPPLQVLPSENIPLQEVSPKQNPATDKQNNFKIPMQPKKFSLRSNQAKRSISEDKSPGPSNNRPGSGNKRPCPDRKCTGADDKRSIPVSNNLGDKLRGPVYKHHKSIDTRQVTNKKRRTKRVNGSKTVENGVSSAVETITSRRKSNIDEEKADDVCSRVRTPSPCPSSKFTSIMSIASATQRDLDTRCTRCKYCVKITKYLELSRKAHLHLEKTQSRGSQQNDVYAFNEPDLISKEPPLLGFRQNRRSKDSNAENNLYLDLLPNSSHIVQLVSVKIPNQDKTIMKAKLVPKSEVNKADLAKNNEEVVTLMEQENFLEELLSSLNGKAPANHVSETEPIPSTSAAPSSCNKDASASGKIVEAPTFYPTEAEFENPFTYLEKITPIASKFGICKIVPPKKFKPPCNINHLTNFSAMNQYPGKMFCRWGSATRDLCAIKASTDVSLRNPPLINNVEVNIPKLYHCVQKLGGLTEVIEKEKWQQVAEEMNYQNGAQLVRKLDQVYVKYLLPYDTLTNRERQESLNKVEKAWNKRYKDMLFRAQNPLLKQKQVLGEASSDEDDDDEGTNRALDKADDCIVQGRSMNLNIFEKVARTIMQMFFGKLDRDPTPQEVEDEYWRLVVLGNEHVCINSAAVDTGEEGYGFPKKSDPYAKHAWNLKTMSNSPGSVLRSLGSVLGLTVPTLHLGMVFSTSCWHRDPHSLPWIEYLHQGASKIWYGIPDKQSDQFRKAVEVLCPAFCQNKSIWLPSDITMIPPNLLKDHNVTLSRIVQKPGEYIIVFPKAYSCSVATGYIVSESVYYAPFSWLATIQNDFQEVRDSFEPTMFPLEQLLIAMAQDARVPSSALPVVHRTLDTIVRDELLNRAQLRKNNVAFKYARHPKKCRAWNARELHECDVCRATLYISKVSGLFDKKNGVYYCLQHALRILETPAHSDRDFSGATVITYYSEEQLEAIIAKLRKRLFPDV